MTAAVLSGTALAFQTNGDCQRRVCDGSGGTTTVADDTDVPVDLNPCTTESCQSGAPVHGFVASGVECASGNALRCDGAGVCAGCANASQCPGTDGPCATRTCTNGICGFDLALAGTAAGTQTSGDCQRTVCDGSGAIVSKADDTDLPVDGNPCTVDSCQAGVPMSAPAAIGTSCGTNLVCDANATCSASPDATLYSQAVADYQAGDYTTARSGFQTLTDSYPSSPFLESALVYVAQCDYFTGDTLSADSELESFIATYPSSSVKDRALYWLGRTRRVVQDFSGAVNAFQQVLSSYPTSTVRDAAQFWLGRSLYDLPMPDYAGALAAFRKTLSDYASSSYRAEAQYWIGRTEFQQGSYAQARADLLAQLTTYGATNAFADIVSIYVGRCDYETGNYATARSEFTAVPMTFPTSTSLDIAEYWLGRTLFASTPPDYAGAQAHFQHVVSTYPASTIVDNAAYWNGRCSFGRRDYRGALGILKAAEMAYPMSNVLDWIIHYEGRSEFQLRTDPDPSIASAALPAAESLFTRQLAGWPTAASAPSGYYWRGRTRYASQNYSSAIADFDAVTNTPAFATTTWLDNAWAYKVRAYADQALCTPADAAYASLKAVSASTTLINSTCSYFRPGLCPGTCP